MPGVHPQPPSTSFAVPIRADLPETKGCRLFFVVDGTPLPAIVRFRAGAFLGALVCFKYGCPQFVMYASYVAEIKKTISTLKISTIVNRLDSGFHDSRSVFF